MAQIRSVLVKVNKNIFPALYLRLGCYYKNARTRLRIHLRNQLLLNVFSYLQNRFDRVAYSVTWMKYVYLLYALCDTDFVVVFNKTLFVLFSIKKNIQNSLFIQRCSVQNSSKILSFSFRHPKWLVLNYNHWIFSGRR